MLREFAHKVGRNTTDGIFTIASFYLRNTFQFFGVFGASALSAVLTHWDHQHEKNRILYAYEREVGAKLGKRADTVTFDDLERLAEGDEKKGLEGNPTIQEALTHNTRRRNLTLIVTTAAMFAAFTIATLALPLAFPAIAGMSAVAQMMIGGTVGFSSFMTLNGLLHKAGAKMMGIDEPELKDAFLNPARQQEMSVSRQIDFLSRVRGSGRLISQEQVATLLVAANPSLAESVQLRFGKPLGELDTLAKGDAIGMLNESFPLRVADQPSTLEQLTADINEGLLGVRELAFAVHGQASGIARLASAPVGVLRRTQERLGHAVQQVKQKVAHTSEEIKDKACEVWDKSCEKANEIKENVAAKLKKPMGEVIAEAQAQEKTYVERYAPDRAQTGKTERLEQQREQLQAAELAGAVR